MNKFIIWIALGLGIILVLAFVQQQRKDRSLEALKQTGFIPDRKWSSAVTFVTEQGTDRFALVRPGDYRIYRADQLLGVDLKSSGMDEGRDQHKVMLRLDDPEKPNVGLPTGNNRRRAEQWSEEIRQWQLQHRGN